MAIHTAQATTPVEFSTALQEFKRAIDGAMSEIRDVVAAEGLSERDRRRLVRELTDYMERLDEMKARILRVP